MEQKLHFETDYRAGCHPQVMEALVKTNMEETVGYGDDHYTAEARQIILDACGLTAEEAEVQFFVGGTQTNATLIDGLLGNCEGVIAADSAHINVHESGAIELSGHKVLALPQKAGKIEAKDLEEYLTQFYADDTWPHMVIPGMVYITHPTEYGALYTVDELKAIRAICQRYHIPLYLDGARLGYALGTSATAPTLKDIAALCDVFYIGGTKCGAMFGEAAVVRRGLIRHLFSLMKQHGAVLAKGRLLGLQFRTLFTDNLYERICGQAVALAQELRRIMTDAGFPAVIDSPTNQQFFEMPNEAIDAIAPHIGFEYWGPRGATHSTVRFVTSWATPPQSITALATLIERMLRKGSVEKEKLGE